MNAAQLSCQARAEVLRYSKGLQSCEATAYTLWKGGLTLPDEPSPSAGDVVLWSRQLGYGIPHESLEEARVQALKAIEFFKAHRD